MTIQTSLGRRGFLASTTAAGAFSLGFSFPWASAQAAEVQELNAWVVIHPDDKVVIRIARSEMGQGTLTGLAQLVAEELECDWSKVTTEYPTPSENVRRNRVWKNYSTGGSRGIRESNQYVREGGAIAREMLIAAAAAEWKVPAAECKAADSKVTHSSGKSATYGQLAAAAAKLELPKEVKLKDPKDWKVAGKPLKRLDTLPKLTGQMTYGIDIKMPGMLTASVRACPVHGGKLKSFDAAKVEKMPGVKQVLSIDNNAVVVVADTYWNAKQALDKLPVEWDVGKLGEVQQDQITAMLKEGLGASEAFVGNKAGDARAAIDGAAKKVEAVYSFPWQHHVNMEPMNATARFTREKCEVWCGTQNGEAALAAAAEAAELPVAKCDVYKTILGTGFGRRGRADYVRQAVLVAKQMPGTPVKLIWSREEDMTHGTYHPTTMCKLTGGLDKDGNLVGLHVRISGQSILAALLPQNLQNGMDPAVFQGFANGGPEAAYGYTVPNLLVDHAMRNPHLTPGFWRGVNTNQNAVYMECFMDELAEAAGQDPLAFRMKMLKPKYAAVLKAATDKAGYGKPLPAGHFHGIAQIMGYGSYVAGVAEVSVSADGVLKVHKITAATDPGHVVNPAQIERQVAGSFVYGLSAALYGEITLKDGAVEQTNFDSYNVMRIDEMPKVETVLAPSGGFWGGVGEPTIAVAAPAVLNGIYKATGKRVRELPLMHQELKKGA
ncbi:MAG: xanthine dehydrogenase family protein molybdopterin-binding subunit [Reyranella sp.]|uniref:xanthine dehydrogenase family protein molybdopterin-binding subunit n=1 Tax=Reyranella sp. TaxID=1929291 RepID=UPI001AC98190|nr:molybdopterin cofactor-binding domain-containing protein [Reyranella sp.]MBN9091495.1 xanthine dehydrogenase family protein molybdopterin-binding subunit [Reyranella sp.]